MRRHLRRRKAMQRARARCGWHTMGLERVSDWIGRRRGRARHYQRSGETPPAEAYPLRQLEIGRIDSFRFITS